MYTQRNDEILFRAFSKHSYDITFLINVNISKMNRIQSALEHTDKKTLMLIKYVNDMKVQKMTSLFDLVLSILTLVRCI